MQDVPTQIGEGMSDEDARTLLASQDHGVLALADDGRGYGFPISYTYDEPENRIIVGFVDTPESKREAFAATTTEATFSVYTHHDVDSWQSVIVAGPITQVEAATDAFEVPDVFYREQSDAPESEKQMVNLDEFGRTWHEIQIDDLSGRQCA